jgi:oxalate decarboxylase/phosphoglucose isomerase-like protein (cupin superfamily)
MITEKAQLNNAGSNPLSGPLSRRNILGIGSSVAGALLAAGTVEAQQRARTQQGKADHSASGTGPENQPLLKENPSSNMPPATDQGDVGPIWYSFDLTHKRIQEVGWTHQVTQRELPSSKDLAGVAAAGGGSVQSPVLYTFRMGAMKPTIQTTSGDARIVDSRNFPVAKNIAAAMLTIRSGGMRELHWHPNTSEWQYYIAGQGCMTVFMPVGEARTMDFKPNDVGYVPAMAGHYIENTGDTDLVVFEMFKAPQFEDVSLNNWLRHLPPEMVTSHLGINAKQIEAIPAGKMEFVGRS